MYSGSSVKCSAVFIDFDNAYSGLRRIDRRAADRFATDPQRWLRWLEGDAEDPERRILVRRCFMNPRAYHQYRPDFVRAAFSIVDCPPLTQGGKTSTDVYVVMAMLDVLAELPHIDEFILFSADADFTPVLLRLRAHDKRTTTLTVGPAAAAYRAAADLVFSEEEFIEDALGFDGGDLSASPPSRSGGGGSVLARMADRLALEVSTTGEIEATALPRLYVAFEEFRDSTNWLGYFSLRGLTDAIVTQRADLELTEGDDGWGVRLVEGAESEPGESVGALGDAIAAKVSEIVGASEAAVVLASVAHAVVKEVGPRVTDSKWARAGTFKAFLAERPELGLEVVTGPGSPGFVYDPERHEAPVLDPRPSRLVAVGPELADFIRRMHGVTQAPLLRPVEYGAVFDAIAEALDGRTYHLTETSRRARDLVLERGYSVPRSAIGFVLKGLYYRDFGLDGSPDGDDIAHAFRDNVLHLADNAHVVFDERQVAFLDDWLLSLADDEDDSDADGGVGADEASPSSSEEAEGSG